MRSCCGRLDCRKLHAKDDQALSLDREFPPGHESHVPPMRRDQKGTAPQSDESCSLKRTTLAMSTEKILAPAGDRSPLQSLRSQHNTLLRTSCGGAAVIYTHLKPMPPRTASPHPGPTCACCMHAPSVPAIGLLSMSRRDSCRDQSRRMNKVAKPDWTAPSMHIQVDLLAHWALTGPQNPCTTPSWSLQCPLVGPGHRQQPV